MSVVLSYDPTFNNMPGKEKPTEMWKIDLFSYWNQYYQSYGVTSTKAAKILFDKWERMVLKLNR